MVWIPWKKEVIETADVIFDEAIVYRDDDIEAAVREEIVILADTPPLPDKDDLFKFDTDQIPWPRVELGTPIPSTPIPSSPPSPVASPEKDDEPGHLPSPESLTLDENEPNNGPIDEADEADDINENSELSGAREEPKVRSLS